VKVRGCRLAEFRERRIAITDCQVAEHLIVRAVFFNDVDHVLNFGAQQGHFLSVLGIQHVTEVVVLRHLSGEAHQLGWRRRREALEAGLQQLEVVLMEALQAAAGRLGTTPPWQ
jgi:hypothetical protein